VSGREPDRRCVAVAWSSGSPDVPDAARAETERQLTTEIRDRGLAAATLDGPSTTMRTASGSPSHRSTPCFPSCPACPTQRTCARSWARTTCAPSATAPASGTYCGSIRRPAELGSTPSCTPRAVTTAPAPSERRWRSCFARSETAVRSPRRRSCPATGSWCGLPWRAAVLVVRRNMSAGSGSAGCSRWPDARCSRRTAGVRTRHRAGGAGPPGRGCRDRPYVGAHRRASPTRRRPAGGPACLGPRTAGRAPRRAGHPGPRRLQGRPPARRTALADAYRLRPMRVVRPALDLAKLLADLRWWSLLSGRLDGPELAECHSRFSPGLRALPEGAARPHAGPRDAAALAARSGRRGGDRRPRAARRRERAGPRCCGAQRSRPSIDEGSSSIKGRF
jgi:hypothetical protein